MKREKELKKTDRCSLNGISNRKFLKAPFRAPKRPPRAMSAPPDPPAAAASQPLSLDPNPPLLPLPSHFHPQSILGRPPNPYAVGRGYPPRPSPVSRGYPGPHMVTVANPAGYIRNNTPTAVVPFPSNSAHVRSAGIHMYHHHQRLQKQHHHHHQSRPPFIARSRSAPEFAPTPIPSLAPKVDCALHLISAFKKILKIKVVIDFIYSAWCGMHSI